MATRRQDGQLIGSRTADHLHLRRASVHILHRGKTGAAIAFLCAVSDRAPVSGIVVHNARVVRIVVVVE